MDFLKQELERKKKERENVLGAVSQVAGTGGTKFFRRADLLNAQEERRRKEQERLDREKEELRLQKIRKEQEAEAALQARLAANAAAVVKARAGGVKRGDEEGSGAVTDETGPQALESGAQAADGTVDGRALGPEEVKERLRSLGDPVTLFGETDEERQARLRKAESENRHDEFALSGGFEMRNLFLEKRKRQEGHHHQEDEDHQDAQHGRKGHESSDEESSEEEGEEGEPEDKEGSAAKRRKAEKGEEGQTGKREVPETGNADPPKPPKPMSDYKHIRTYWRGLLKRWEQDLNARPDAVKRTVQGKMETKTQKQCKDYIRPLFKLCKRKELPDVMRRNLLKMTNYCIEGEFVKANEVYLQTAIGNAPWPIGLTMVGIHERTGREKIMENKVAHVMNNEMQRKYLTSVKRLMAYEQEQRTDVPPSKKVR